MSTHGFNITGVIMRAFIKDHTWCPSTVVHIKMVMNVIVQQDSRMHDICTHGCAGGALKDILVNHSCEYTYRS